MCLISSCDPCHPQLCGHRTKCPQFSVCLSNYLGPSWVKRVAGAPNPQMGVDVLSQMRLPIKTSWWPLPTASHQAPRDCQARASEASLQAVSVLKLTRLFCGYKGHWKISRSIRATDETFVPESSWLTPFYPQVLPCLRPCIT